MPERDPPPLERLADLIIFAPLGLALEARRLWPDLAERGREQLNVARDARTRALGAPYDWLDHRLARLREEADAALRGLGLTLPTDHAHEAVGARGADTGSVEPPPVIRLPTQRHTPTSERPAPAAPGVDVSDLAIPDYDSLSASQVVPRLAALQPAELDLVRRYEAAVRGRKTILNRIAQLQTG